MKKHFYIFICSFFFSLGANILGFSMIFRLSDKFMFNTGQIGTFIALGNLFYFLGCNLYHRFVYVFNPVKVFTASTVVVFFASLPIGFGSITMVYAAYWIIQICAGLFWPPIMAHLTSGLSEKELNRETSFFNRSWMSGLLVGPLVSGALYNWNSSANFVVLSISYSLALILLLIKFKSGVAMSTSSFGKKTAHAPKTIDKRLDYYRYQAWIGAFCSSMVIGVVVNIMPIHIRDGLGYTERSAGMIIAMRCVAGFIGFTLVAKFSKWHFSRKWFMMMQGSFMICVLLFLITGSHIILLGIVIFMCGLFNSACYNNSLFYSSVTGKDPKRNMALHEIVMALGGASGSAGGGFIYQHYHIPGISIALLTLLGIGMGVFVFINKRLFK